MARAIEIGQEFTVNKRISEDDVKQFAEISTDHNPLHLNEEIAARSIFKRRVAHGMLTASLISAALASMPGTIILLEISLSFKKPVFINDTLAAKAIVTKVENDRISLDVEVTRNVDKVVIGTARILQK